MSWLITWDGVEYDSDDFLISDLGRVERESGTPWSVANCFRDVGVAKAFLGVAMRRSGLSDKEATEKLDAVTMRELKNAFRWKADDDGEEEQEAQDPSDQNPNLTTEGSSRTDSDTESPLAS